jgi:type II secretory pathway component PulF
MIDTDLGALNVTSQPVLQLAVAIGAELPVTDPALQQLAEFVAVHLARQAQRLGALAVPFGRREAVLGVIVVSLVVVACLR